MGDINVNRNGKDFEDIVKERGVEEEVDGSNGKELEDNTEEGGPFEISMGSDSDGEDSRDGEDGEDSGDGENNSQDIDFIVGVGYENLDSDFEMPLEDDDIFRYLNQEVPNEGNSNPLMGNTEMNNEGDNHPHNLVVEDMTEFNEAAPDLDDELRSLEGSDYEGGPPNVMYNRSTPNLALGMVFRSGKDFRKALRRWCIETANSYDLMKNNKSLVHAGCKQKPCKFKIRASKVRDTETFRIKSFNPVHTCPRVHNEKMLKTFYISERYLEDIRDDKTWKVHVMKRKIKRDLGYNVSIRKCYRAKSEGLKIIYGEIREEYRRLYDYAETLRVTNPGTMVKFKTELTLDHGEAVPREIVVFQHMYVRLAAQKQGYFSGIRPIIGLDGCHLKGMMGGHLLAAVGRDGNENLFPIAIAVVDSECKESWSWFLQVLQDDFGTVRETGWVFMSDQQKGLVESFKELMPDVEHRFCVKHMYENMKLRFKGMQYKEYLWNAAVAGTVRHWQYHMDKLRAYDDAEYQWVMNHDPHTWERSHFSTRSKCDAVQNNICESFNKYILEARDLPILGMVEWIRKALMKRQYIKLTGMGKYAGNICPNYQELLEKIKLDSKLSFCTEAGDKLYEVETLERIVAVDLNARTCTCRMWDISGIPCKHAVAAIIYQREQPEAYVHQYFTKSTYMAVYQHMYRPVPSKEEWERTSFPDIHPGIVRKPPGRPKKRRIRRADEPRDQYRISRAGLPVKCGKCQQQGHNASSCKAGITGESTWQRRKRIAAEKKNGTYVQNGPPNKGGRPRKPTNATSNTATQGGRDSGRGRSPVNGGRGGNGSGSGRIPLNNPLNEVGSSSQPSRRQNAGNDDGFTRAQSQPVAGRGGGRGRGRGRIPTTNSSTFKPPRPNYAATTVSASRKRVNTDESLTINTRSKRADVLGELAQRHGHLTGNLVE